MAQQPWLHDMEIAVSGPATCVSDRSGAIGASGTGWFVDDRRAVSFLDVRLGAAACVPVASDTTGNRSTFLAVARHLGDDAPDPTVTVHRERRLLDGVLTEIVVLTSRATTTVDTALRVHIAGDGADISVVKQGRDADLPSLVPTEALDGWVHDLHHVTIAASPAPRHRELADAGVVWSWSVTLAPHESVTVALTVEAHRTRETPFASRAVPDAAAFAVPKLRTGGVWDDLVRTNLDDLRHLVQSDPEDRDDVFAGAGSPWYLTLFGRDSLWTARFLTPFAPRLAHGTLRALARRQATATDPVTAAEPGKILHEVRRSAFHGVDMTLPPVYYGTVDATPLWICLLCDAWAWGLSTEDVRELLPHLRVALDWMRAASERSPDGFLRYIDRSGHGLANQGWKDSGDSMRRRDGSIAPAPIALVEAQGYAVEAARGAADVLDALGEHGAAEWRAFADEMVGRIRRSFWVEDAVGPYLAMAIDGEGEPVDGVGSNMGHVLGTGALTRREEDLVVARLMRPDMLRRFGIATLSADNPAYNPIGYHTGSVWTHDTAVVLRGLVASGYRQEADRVIEALTALSLATKHRFPELTAGDELGAAAVPYPAACRPQAWSAASAGVLAMALAGVHIEEGQIRTIPSALLPHSWSLAGVQRAGVAIHLGA